MAVSNDWQLINQIGYIRPTQTDGGSGYDTWFMNKASAEKIAAAIGWEQVELSDYVEETSVVFTYNDIDYAYKASDVHLIRPVADADEDEYNTGLLPYAYIHPVNSGSSSSYRAGTLVFQLNNGEYLGYIDNMDLSPRCPSSFQLLRTSGSGGFAFKSPNGKFQFFDKFYNPKVNKTKWGFFRHDSESASRKFCDCWSGLIISYHNGTSSFKVLAGSPPFIALKKFTAIASAGVFNARTIYRSYFDYNSSSKVVEIGGKKYVGMNNYTSAPPFYIPLSD